MATRLYDSVEFLTDEPTILAYLQAAIDTNDHRFFISCLDKAIRARAINQLTETTGIDRDQIYEMFTNVDSDPLIIKKIQATFNNCGSHQRLTAPHRKTLAQTL